MITHNINPIALQFNFLSIYWYGLMYVIGFTLFLILGKYRIKIQNWHNITFDELQTFLIYAIIGVILGGRLGEVLLYQPGYWLSHPLNIFLLSKSGMSFHGAFIGSLISIYLFSQKYNKSFLQIADFIVPLVPLGLACGRFGNFINGELYGRVASPHLPWATVFTKVDTLPRHPSQLYQALLEGILLFIILWLFSQKKRPLGRISAIFLILYGVFRFLTEYFRTPDAGIFGQSYMISMGQLLCIPMIILGLFLYKKAP